MKSQTTSRWLTTEEAGNLMGIAPQTLRRMRCEGRGPAYIKINRQVVKYDRRDIDDFLKRHRIDPAAA